ncbi:uncharacterized protein LOC135375206 isoform X1 [Ornithodoros turicata]|uniref:uncharacterized protein LOC135375206 isoform X1 n=1 Tax=Ornithodoros turicata TaxID=34597 RepID=UPI003138CCC5
MQDSWQRALKFRTKNQRKKLSHIPEVEEQRQRFNLQKRKVPPHSNEPKRVCFRAMNGPALTASPPNETFHERLAWLRNEKPTVLEVLRRYHSLATTSGIHEEFSQHSGKNAVKELLWLLNTKAESIIQLARKRKSGASVVSLVNEKLKEVSCQSEQKYCYSVGAIYALSHILKESAAAMFTSEENAVYPTIISHDPFKFESCSVAVEGSRYEVDDTLAAIATAFELY